MSSSTVAVSEARASLPALLERVAAGEEITLTRHGEPVAVLVRPDSLRRRRAAAAYRQADRIQELLDESPDALPEPWLEHDEADERVRDLRSDRRAR